MRERYMFDIQISPAAAELFQNRQIELLKWTLRGGPTKNKQAAAAFNITRQTVKNHWYAIQDRITDKFGVRPYNKIEAINILLEEGILTLTPVAKDQTNLL